MEIIKRGDGDPQWLGDFKCTGKGNSDRGCQADLRIRDSDLFVTYNSCMGRDETYYLTFMCPQCGNLTDIMDTDGYCHPKARNLTKAIRDFPQPSAAVRKQAQEHLMATGEYVPPHQFTSRPMRIEPVEFVAGTSQFVAGPSKAEPVSAVDTTRFAQLDLGDEVPKGRGGA